jgi:RNA polymerase-binding transcription factor DksA
VSSSRPSAGDSSAHWLSVRVKTMAKSRTRSSNPANLAADLYQEEFDEGLTEDLRRQLDALERAEQRLAAGTYGRSTESGLRISDARLEARPTAELTADEARAWNEP